MSNLLKMRELPMKSHIVHDSEPITLLGAGCFGDDALTSALSIGPILVAADGGAKLALEKGHMPQAVIGDFDSLDADSRAAIPENRLHYIPEQETTDFEKCLTRISAPLILGVGFAGARLDHELAALNALVRHPHKRCILIGADDITFLAPPDIKLDLPGGSRLSLFPFGRVNGTSDGLRWPIKGLKFAPDGRIGTSNEVTGPLTLRFDAPKMLMLLPRQALGAVAKALAALPETWPAP